METTTKVRLTTFYLVNIKDMPAVAKVREEMFEGCKPASGTIPIKSLLLPQTHFHGSLIEGTPPIVNPIGIGHRQQAIAIGSIENMNQMSVT